MWIIITDEDVITEVFKRVKSLANKKLNGIANWIARELEMKKSMRSDEEVIRHINEIIDRQIQPSVEYVVKYP